MKCLSYKLLGRALIALSPVFILTATADDSSSRLEAYKGNGLVPQNLNVDQYVASSAKTSGEVCVFTPTALSWVSKDPISALAAKYSKYSEITKSDLENMQFDTLDSVSACELLNYLGLIESGDLTSDRLTKEDILSMQNIAGGTGLFLELYSIDLSDVTNWPSIANTSYFSGCTFAALPNAGIINDCDISAITDISSDSTVILEGVDLQNIAKESFDGGKFTASYCSLPNMQLTGTEDFSGLTLNGDLSMLNGLTVSQLGVLASNCLDSSIYAITKLPTMTETIDYNLFKSLLRGRDDIYLDELFTTMPGVTIDTTTKLETNSDGTLAIKKLDPVLNLTTANVSHLTSLAQWYGAKITEQQWQTIRPIITDIATCKAEACVANYGSCDVWSGISIDGFNLSLADIE